MNHFFFSFCTLFSNIFCKINFMAKKRSDLHVYIFYRKLDFRKKIIGKYVLLFSTDFLLLMFHNNTLKISENLKKWNLLKKPT